MERQNRPSDDDCALVVFDAFFQQSCDPTTGKALAEAMRRRLQFLGELSQLAPLIPPALTERCDKNTDARLHVLPLLFADSVSLSAIECRQPVR